MVVQSNIPAINAHRNLGINNNALSKNLEKLSSGYKINRAGDDAAGLAISEKMRSQIRGLEMAEQNTENAVSLIQTAEGGLNETHAILQRMRELAVQSSNGTYTDEDRAQITLEYDALMSEVTRIAESTHYNGINLLDGSLDAATLMGKATADDNGIVNSTTLGANVTQGTSYTVSNLVAGTATAATNATSTVSLNGLVDGTPAAGTFDFTLTVNGTSVTKTITTATNSSDTTLAAAIATAFASEFTGFAVTDNGDELVITASTAGSAAGAGLQSVSYSTANSNNSTVSDGQTGNGTYVAGKDKDDPELKVDFAGQTGVDASFNAADNTWSLTASDGTVVTLNNAAIQAMSVQQRAAATATIEAAFGENLTFQIGANGGADQRVDLGIADMSAAALGITASRVGTRPDADAAITTLDRAINTVSSQRASLGALQNRLEHTLNSLGVSIENLSAAESTIRDTDMASEMMKFTQNSILVQASQAMLAQANALPQGILSLLG